MLKYLNRNSKQYEKIKKELDDSLNERILLKRELTKLNSELNFFKHKMYKQSREYENDLNNKINENDVLNKELDGVLKEKENIENDLNNKINENDVLNKKLDGVLKEKENIENDLNNKINENDVLNKELDGVLKEKENIENNLNNKINENDLLNKKLDGVLKEKENIEIYFNKQITEKDFIINNLNFYKKKYLHKFNSLKSKNIAYVLAGFPTLSQTFVLNELRWLKENGFNVKVFSYIDAEKPVKLDFDLDVYRFDMNENLMENLEKLIKEHKIDLLHTHFVWPTCTKFTYPIAKKLRVPFTFFAHAFDIFIKDIDAKNKIEEMTNCEFCKGVFTLSEFHKNYLLQRNVPKFKIFITKQASNYEISPLKKKNNPIRNIVSISRFVEKKGIDTLIDAAKLLEDEDLEFNIYGFGDLESEYQNQIDNLNLKNVFLKGSLNGFEEVKNVLNNSDLLVSPCRVAKNGDIDGIPTIIFEAMGFGVPVITTNVSAIPEVIFNNENGFIAKPDIPELLALRIKEVMKLSNDELFEIRKKAQIDVQNVSSVENTMNNVLKTWCEIFKL